jgi:hypothetical protein
MPKSIQNGQVAYYVENQLLFMLEARDAQSNALLHDRRRLLNVLKTRFNGLLRGNTLLRNVRDFGVDKDRSAALVLVFLKPKDGDAVSEFIQGFYGGSAPGEELEDGGQGVRLIDVHPNWLAGGAPQVIGTGGPGGPPKKPSQLTLPVGSRTGLASRFFGDNRSSGQCQVDVYILDTLKDPSDLESNLQSLYVPIPAAQGMFSDLFDPPDSPKYVVSDPYYDMSDHGPFIAGIVKQIAPGARAHVVEVLNQYGIGTVESIAAGFDAVRELRKATGQSGRHAIVNCSFSMSIPVLVEKAAFRRKYSPHTSAGLPGPIVQMLTKLDPEWPSRLIDAVTRLESNGGPGESGCQIVAAAGNDSDANTIRPARYPARLGSILGVGALNANNSRASYSNYPDSPTKEGLMALGDGRSLYTGRFPLLAPNNTVVARIPANPNAPATPKMAKLERALSRGLADWSGTSFAAPVVAGLLAKLVCENSISPTAAAQQLGARPTQPVTGGKVAKYTEA